MVASPLEAAGSGRPLGVSLPFEGRLERELHRGEGLLLVIVLAGAGCGLTPASVGRSPGVAASSPAPVAAAAVQPALGREGLRVLQRNPAVEARVEHLLRRDRRTLQVALERSRRFVSMIEAVFAEHGLPPELAYLPMVESRFLPDARGRRAVGLWQFTRATARRYGLVVNRRVDERRDPAKSTRAAARYLRDLYGQFRSWGLALAAYNAGPGRVRRALRRRPEAGFFELARERLLPPITRRYVPKVLAISLIGPEPERFGVEITGLRSARAVRGGPGQTS